MIEMKLDQSTVKAISKKLKTMPAKMQKKAVRSVINPEAVKLQNQFKSITPVGKRKHKNKYAKRMGAGFLKKSFSVRNSGRGDTVGRKIITRATGYYIHMSPNQTGRKAGTKSGKKGTYRWGAVSGLKKYTRLWEARQRRVTKNLTTALANELKRV